MPEQSSDFSGCIARMRELSRGKDTITGHWEIAGILRILPGVFPADRAGAAV